MGPESPCFWRVKLQCAGRAGEQDAQLGGLLLGRQNLGGCAHETTSKSQLCASPPEPPSSSAALTGCPGRPTLSGTKRPAEALGPSRLTVTAAIPSTQANRRHVFTGAAPLRASWGGSGNLAPHPAGAPAAPMPARAATRRAAGSAHTGTGPEAHSQTWNRLGARPQALCSRRLNWCFRDRRPACPPAWERHAPTAPAP